MPPHVLHRTLGLTLGILTLIIALGVIINRYEDRVQRAFEERRKSSKTSEADWDKEWQDYRLIKPGMCAEQLKSLNVRVPRLTGDGRPTGVSDQILEEVQNPETARIIIDVENRRSSTNSTILQKPKWKVEDIKRWWSFRLNEFKGTGVPDNMGIVGFDSSDCVIMKQEIHYALEFGGRRGP